MKVNRIPRLSNLWKSASNFLAAIREVISLAWSASSIPLQMKKSLRKQTNPQAGKKDEIRSTGRMTQIGTIHKAGHSGTKIRKKNDYTLM